MNLTHLVTSLSVLQVIQHLWQFHLQEPLVMMVQLLQLDPEETVHVMSVCSTK